MPRSSLLLRFFAVTATAGLCAAGLAFAPGASAATAETFYVAPNGNDGNAGTSASAPLRTLQVAQGKVRQALAAGLAPGVQVAGGTYELSAALAFGPADSGTAGSPVVWRAASGAQVTLAGGRQLQPAWSASPSMPGVYTAQIGAGITMDGLFVNARRQVLARYPNVNPSQTILDGFTSLAAVQAEAHAKNWKHPQLADLRALHCNGWGGASFKVTGLNAGGSLALNWVGDNNRAAACGNPSQPLDPNHVVVENVLEELDAPGEWYYDLSAGTLYYYPPSGTNLSGAVVQTAETDELIHLEGGSNTAAVHDITFSGFTFTATHRTLFDRPYQNLQLGDWAVARTGAFYTKNAANITVTGSVFDQLGGNGVFMDGYNSGNVVSNDTFTDDGATDVQTVGSTAAVRDPSTWSHMVTTLDDTTPGPKTQDYPRNITISGNQMSGNGRFEKQSAGVNISMSQGVKVLGNTIHGSPRSCVNINDGTWGGDLVQDNSLFDCVKETSDHGPINMWGRDRFWPLSGGDAVQKQYARLDVATPDVINHNLIWHDSQWDLDLDDGTSNYQLTNNLLLNAGIKLRDGFYRTVTNNIVVNGSIYEQVSHANDGDVIEHNIVLSGQPYQLTQSDPASAKYVADYNLFWNNGGPVTGLGGSWSGNGEDTHSQTANPLFTAGNPWTDPSMLDYTVSSTSPALGLGFTNFPMNTFGVPGSPTPPAVAWPGSGGGSVGPLHAVGAGKCLDDPGATTTGGTQQEIYDCNGGANQTWTHTSSGQLTLSLNGGIYCLDANGQGTGNGTEAITWSCNGQSNQQWSLG